VALASCSFDTATGVTQEGKISVTCRGMANLSADRCGLFGDAALANMGDVDGQAAAVEVDISPSDGECQRVGATVFDRAGRAFASVSLACPTH
jgi:hypothetical protein